MPPHKRPEGTDGGDHAYRMTVEQRYKQRAVVRKRLRSLALSNITCTLIRVAYHALPLLLHGAYRPSPADAFFAASGVSALLFLLGSGLGRAHREKLWMLKAYCFINIVLAVSMAVSVYLHGTVVPEEGSYPALLAGFLHKEAGLPADVGTTITLVAQGILDACWAAALAGATTLDLTYLRLTRDTSKKSK
ncbi:hypothetical protein WJX72_011595 [[Myrmecia] bisecta]|uniref:Uncharacterized protein n=1 Tax=[Myrmecia] bisecta TaxID=41462 RepID=A0AAW1Q5Q6_9CHLO